MRTLSEQEMARVEGGGVMDMVMNVVGFTLDVLGTALTKTIKIVVCVASFGKLCG